MKIATKQQFPLVEAILLTPPEGTGGEIGICTNTSAPGQIVNEIEMDLRSHVSVLGTVIVSRDGTERMIINSLVHPTLKYLVLFSEESVTFAPGTNLLQAILAGFDKNQTGNYIIGGVGASFHFPNINEKIFNLFKEEIIVIPAFMHKNEKSPEIIKNYLSYLKPKVDRSVYNTVVEINSKDKIYFDSLNKLIKAIAKAPQDKKTPAELDPIDFQHLQPPKIELDNLDTVFNTSFRVSRQNKNLRLDIELGDLPAQAGKKFFIIGDDPFILEYSLMKYIGEDKNLISPIDQIILGAELGRVSTEIFNDVSIPPFVAENNIVGSIQIPLEPAVHLITDKRYYYKINTRGNKISAMCLAFDVCEAVFELLSTKFPAIAERLARENRFENYEMDILHRMDIGTQLGRAAIAAHFGYSFIQDFSAIFKINKETLPSIIVEGDSFLDVHKSVLRGIYTKGITEEHGDSWKGLARSASKLAIYRNAVEALESMPAIYRQGDQDSKTVREKYKAELLRFDHDGSYSYGQRTRVHFGFDQLLKSIGTFKKDSSRATIIQRFDPATDMTSYIDKDTGKKKYTHDPCLTHDIFFVQNDKLHSFHIARAHNAVNAYPENIFGLFDAYDTTIRQGLGLVSGDMYMLSNRANILLLTEEQRTKKILGEPSKPVGDLNTTSGPYRLDNNTKKPEVAGGVAYFLGDMQKETNIGDISPILNRIKNYRGIDTLEKAVNYLKEKGSMHNNPVLSEYYAGESDPQGDLLVFYQGNVFGGKFYATAVFMNRSLKNLEEDKKLVNYLSTQFANNLSVNLGAMAIYYVAYRL
ncbi:MAG: hypothetical protein HY507_02290 [Candidatus Zambryskibacteria bacterium]|nr:hypothetical protein [Candidatus Zambryskibacteria bacterium]